MKQLPQNEKLKLENIAKELTQIFHSETITNKSTRVDEYIDTMIKTDALEGKTISDNTYADLSCKIKSEILPRYEIYAQKKAEIEKEQKNMKWQKYVGGTIVFLEVLEAVLTRGKSLSPAILLTTIPIEAGIGYVVFNIAKYSKSVSLNNAEKKLYRGLRAVDKKNALEEKYNELKMIGMNETTKLQKETNDLLSQYSSPAMFWQDYTTIIQKDPTTTQELINTDIQKFSTFLKSHLDGTYSENKRKERFNTLFIEAHKFFSENDPNYIKNQIKNQINKM